MYPDLSYFFHDLFGTAPDNWISIFKTFGLFLVLAILVAAWFLYSELRRKAGEGLFQATKVTLVEGRPASAWDLFSNALFGFLIGFKIPYLIQYFEAFKTDPSGILLSAKGNWPAGIAAAILFTAYRYWQTRRKATRPQEKTVSMYPHDRIGDITIIAAISGVAGAKIFALIEDLPAFFNDPLGTFFSGSGLAIYGGLIGGFIGVSIYLRRKKIPVIPVLDAVAPALIIAYGVGRLGCHFSGDGDWGIEAATMPSWWFLPDWLWAYDYPHNVVNDGVLLEGCTWRYCHHLAPPVYPTPLYESVMSFAIGGILWGMRRRIRIGGMLFFLYLILNGVERFFIEKIRVNIRYDILGISLTQAEIIALALFGIGLLGMIYLWRRHHTGTAT